MEQRTILLPDTQKTYTFTQAEDGFWYSEEVRLALTPELDECFSWPWYADHVCDPPMHDFKVINEG